jgi:virginiamycin A acetyltransferase
MKSVARGLASIATIPLLVSFHVRAWLLGRDRAFQASSEWLAMVPGVIGQYLRRAFLHWTCEGCGPETVIGFGALFSTTKVRIDGNAYVGPQCNIGWAHIERDVLLAAGVQVPSGPHTHGIERLDVPIRDQPGTPRLVRIGEGTWVGNGAIVMADVGRHAIVAVGAVVTKPLPDFAIAVGVPARVIRTRDQASAIGE